MATTVGTFMLRRLAEWGVQRVYGYPGDGINGLLGAFHESRRPSSCRPATRRSRRSSPAHTRSTRARSASAWPPRALAKGEPSRRAIIAEAVKGKLAEFTTR